MSTPQEGHQSTDCFTIHSPTAPRLARLALPSRNALETPHYIAISSRGVVPHITPDTLTRSTNVQGVYVGLEDFIERASSTQLPPLFQFRPDDGTSPLRAFTALPDSMLLVVGARRTPPLTAPAANSNTNTTVSVSTAVGFKALSAEYYAEHVDALGADIVIALGDIPHGRALASKRIEKATDRQIKWLSDHVQHRHQTSDELSEHVQARAAKPNAGVLFAPLLPVSCAAQQYFIECVEQHLPTMSGLAIYSPSTLEDLPPSLQHLPRLGLTAPETPHAVLTQISAGIDILTIPFVGAATDAGIALAFHFPPSTPSHPTSPPRALGIDMWLPSHATSTTPLVESCACFACTQHHRAYVQHLLAAKEMLGWVLLQIHNHHIVDKFFEGIRESIAKGRFEEDVGVFRRAYEPELPEKTGRGPRVRGYHFKSEGPGEPRRNPAAFSVLADGSS